VAVARTPKLPVAARVWRTNDVAITLPMAVAQAMLDRARRWAVDAGGRFEAQEDMVLLWSGSFLTCASPRPIGCFTIRWRWPTHDSATIDRLQWHPSYSTPDEIRLAVDVLVGLSRR
jgi:hypothetical protein